MPHHARVDMWTVAHSHRWFARCDQCGRWRLFGWYYELYPPLHSKGSEAGWWWACADCLVDIISDRLFTVGEMLVDYQEWETDLLMDDEAWGGNTRSLPVLTRRLLDRLIEMQGPREDVISAKVAEGRLTINRARRLLRLQPFENTLVDTPEKAAEVASAFMRAVAGEHDEVFGPCILDDQGEPLIAVNHLIEDAERLRDRLLVCITARRKWQDE